MVAAPHEKFLVPGYETPGFNVPRLSDSETTVPIAVFWAWLLFFTTLPGLARILMLVTKTLAVRILTSVVSWGRPVSCSRRTLHPKN